MGPVRRPGPAGALSPLPIIAVLACTVLAGCANIVAVRQASAAGHPAAPRPPAAIVCVRPEQVDRLTMRRVNTFPQNHEQFTFPAQITVTDAWRARAVALALCALPLFPQGRINCPADLAVYYELSFASGARRFQVVTIDSSGCELVDGLGATRWAVGGAFWWLLGSAAGIPHPGNAAFGGSIADLSG